MGDTCMWKSSITKGERYIPEKVPVGVVTATVYQKKKKQIERKEVSHFYSCLSVLSNDFLEKLCWDNKRQKDPWLFSSQRDMAYRSWFWVKGESQEVSCFYSCLTVLCNILLRKLCGDNPQELQKEVVESRDHPYPERTYRSWFWGRVKDRAKQSWTEFVFLKIFFFFKLEKGFVSRP